MPKGRILYIKTNKHKPKSATSNTKIDKSKWLHNHKTVALRVIQLHKAFKSHDNRLTNVWLSNEPREVTTSKIAMLSNQINLSFHLGTAAFWLEFSNVRCHDQWSYSRNWFYLHLPLIFNRNAFISICKWKAKLCLFWEDKNANSMLNSEQWTANIEFNDKRHSQIKLTVVTRSFDHIYYIALLLKSSYINGRFVVCLTHSCLVCVCDTLSLSLSNVR